MPAKKRSRTTEEQRNAVEEEARLVRDKEEAHYAAALPRAQLLSEQIRAASEALSPDDPEVRWRFEILLKKLPTENVAILPNQCAVRDEMIRVPGKCVSCHEPIDKAYPWRCPACIRALHLVWKTQAEAKSVAASVVVLDDDFDLDDIA